MAGSSRTERELVTTVGSRTTGIAMPVRVPNIESASSRPQPEAMSAEGMRMDSALAKRFKVTRLAVSGGQAEKAGGSLTADDTPHCQNRGHGTSLFLGDEVEQIDGEYPYDLL